MKALVGAFNQEEALVGAFSVIVQCTTGCGTDGALHSTNQEAGHKQRNNRAKRGMMDEYDENPLQKMSCCVVTKLN